MRVKQENVGNGLDQVSVQRLELKISPSSRKRMIFKTKVGRNVAQLFHVYYTPLELSFLIAPVLMRPDENQPFLHCKAPLELCQALVIHFPDYSCVPLALKVT